MAELYVPSPRRIRLSRAKGWRKPANTVVVSRPTKFGNPFGPPDGLSTGSRELLVKDFTNWLRWPTRFYRHAGTPGGFTTAAESEAARQRLVNALPGLTGKDLGCWCHLDQPCHADVLLELAAGRLRVDPARVLVTGSRGWTDLVSIRNALAAAISDLGVSPSMVTVVHGAAPGADSLAGSTAWDLGMFVERHPADWQRHGRSAGHVRNAEMVRLGADLCLAFPLGESRGSRGCMRLATLAGIPVRNLGDPDPAAQLDLFGEVA